MNLRLTLIIVNLIAFATIGIIILWRVFSLRRNPEPRPPQNLTPFLPDEELEGRKLERVLLISLLTTAFIALTLFVYYVFEPWHGHSNHCDVSHHGTRQPRCTHFWYSATYPFSIPATMRGS